MDSRGTVGSGATAPGVWFVGDLGDPWVAGLSAALPAPWPSRRLDCPGELPDDPFRHEGPPDVLVLHRAVLTGHDAERVRRWRSDRSTPRIVLCHGPHARAADLERWAGVVDALLPEATARESLARLVGVASGRDRRAEVSARVVRPRVAVVSGQFATRQMVAEAVEAAGYPVAPARDWSDAPPEGPAVWDVPVLEPGWPEALARRSRVGPVIALIGFADRELVDRARQGGASACLELPFDLEDLAAALGRIAAPRHRAEPPHPSPPPPVARRRPAAGARASGPGRPG